MAKKDYFLILDSETTQDALIADFAAVIVDRKGNIFNQCAILINGVFNDAKNHPLFFNPNADDKNIWSDAGKDRRYKKYYDMIADGSRMIASVAAVNRWLERAKGKYDPIVTAYNFPFDKNKCENTGIDLTIFKNSFCLWAAAFDKWGQTKKYKQFVLAVHGFNPPTELGNMTYKTNAEIMARFVLSDPTLADEPHTALEDIIFYELPIFKALAKTTKKADMLAASPYDWRAVQVKEHFKAI